MDGANKDYIENGISHISKYLVEDANEAIFFADTIVIGNGTKSFGEDMSHVEKHKTIIDLVRLNTLSDEVTSRDTYKGICW
jgi:GDP-mannose 6-dehydrogenase